MRQFWRNEAVFLGTGASSCPKCLAWLCPALGHFPAMTIYDCLREEWVKGIGVLETCQSCCAATFYAQISPLMLGLPSGSHKSSVMHWCTTGLTAWHGCSVDKVGRPPAAGACMARSHQLISGPGGSLQLQLSMCRFQPLQCQLSLRSQGRSMKEGVRWLSSSSLDSSEQDAISAASSLPASHRSFSLAQGQVVEVHDSGEVLEVHGGRRPQTRLASHQQTLFPTAIHELSSKNFCDLSEWMPGPGDCFKHALLWFGRWLQDATAEVMA